MFNDMLLATLSYPQPTSSKAISRAVDFAARLHSTISCMAFEISLSASLGYLSEGMLDVEGMIAAVQRKSSAAARDILETFRNEAGRREVLGDCLLKTCPNSDVTTLLVGEARVHDLTVIPIADVDGIEQWYGEAVVFGSGRPVLILPEAGPAPRLDSVLVAWDGTRAAARALSDALPLLSLAKTISVVTIVGEKPLGAGEFETDLTRHFARHNLKFSFHQVESKGRAIGDVLASAAAQRECDLLVMGAFGHSRIRDFVLGGATKSMLANPPLPLFLSH